MATKTEFRFDYKKYETKNVSIDELDQVWAVIKSPSTSSFQYAAKGLFLIFLVAYIFIRKSLIDEKMHIAKQEYEGSRTNSNSGQIGNDDLD